MLGDLYPPRHLSRSAEGHRQSGIYYHPRSAWPAPTGPPLPGLDIEQLSFMLGSLMVTELSEHGDVDCRKEVDEFPARRESYQRKLHKKGRGRYAGRGSPREQ
jgi:hypothetical protein